MDITRAQLIINYINNYTFATVKELCDEFHVSSATMRRDLASLEQQGQICRVHGGARKIISELQRTGISYDTRIRNAVKEKEAIANYASSLIEPNDTVFFDSSTTVLKITEILIHRQIHATIITNDFFIANMINNSSNLDLIFIGGYVEKDYLYTKGLYAEEMLKNIYIHKAFIAFDNIDISRGITMNCMSFVRFKQLALEHSSKKYAVGEHHKFKSESAYQICGLSDLDAVITDSGISDEIVHIYKSNKCRLLTAPILE